MHAGAFEAQLKGLPDLLRPKEAAVVRLCSGGADGWPGNGSGQVIAFDLETSHLNPRLGGVLNFGWADGNSEPTSVRVMDPPTLKRLWDFYTSDAPKAVFYSHMEMGWGWHHLGVECKNVVADPYLMALRLDEEPDPGTKTLEYLSAMHFPAKYAGYKFATQEGLSNGQADLIDPAALGTRNAIDAEATRELVPVYEKLLGPEQVAYHRAYDLPIASAVARMAHQGLAVDVGRLRSLRAECVDLMNAALKKVEEIKGSVLNVGSTKQLRELLSSLGVDTGKETPKGAMSTDENALLGISHPVADPIIEYRKADKIRGTYCAGIEDAIEAGMVYPNWRWPGTVTKRLSCSEPNFQNLPVRTILGKKVREAIVSRWGGGRLWNCDLSQIEPRCLASLSKDRNLIRIFIEGGDPYMEVVRRAFGASAGRERRAAAKTAFLGWQYNVGAKTARTTIRKETGILLSMEDVEAFLRGCDDAYPQASAYMAGLRRDAMNGRDIVSPIGGYTYHTRPRLASCRNKWQVMEVGRSAANSPIQTAGAILTSVALARISLALTGGDAIICAQVHDEVVGDARSEQVANDAAQTAKEIMVAVCDEQEWFLVPGAAECAVAENWAKLK